MELRLLAWMGISAAVVAFSPAQAAGPLNSFVVGNWSAGSYTANATGQFSHCAASTSYRSGIRFYVSVTRNFQWMLGFNNAAWKLARGASFPIRLEFDGAKFINLRGKVETSTFVIVPMAANSTLVRAFREASVMTAHADGGRFSFKLDGTSKLLPALVECVRKGNAEQSAPAPSGAPQASAPPVNPEAQKERQKLIQDAAAAYETCARTKMREIVPYSNEGAETLAQVVITSCEPEQEKFIKLGMALFNSPRAAMQKIVADALENRKKRMVAEIVTFRAALTKELMNKPSAEQQKPVTSNGI